MGQADPELPAFPLRTSGRKWPKFLFSHDIRKWEFWSLLHRLHCGLETKACATEVCELAMPLVRKGHSKGFKTITLKRTFPPRYGAHLEQMVANGLDRVSPGPTCFPSCTCFSTQKNNKPTIRIYCAKDL